MAHTRLRSLSCQEMRPRHVTPVRSPGEEEPKGKGKRGKKKGKGGAGKE